MSGNRFVVGCVCTALLVAASACGPEPEAPPTPVEPSPAPAPVAVSTAPVNYACESGQAIQVQYPDTATAQLKHRNQTYLLRTAATPTGVRYIGSGVEWTVATGDGLENATLSRLGPNDQVGSAVLERCSRPTSDMPATPAPAPAPGGALPAAGLPCRGPQLKMSSEGGDAGAGNRVAVLGVQNIGTRTCTLTGYPVVTLQDGQARALSDVRADQSPGNYFRNGTAPTPVVLAPQAKAYFDLAWNIVPHEGNGETVCPTATRIRMTAPGDTSPANLAMRFTPCGGRVRVSPFRPVVEDAPPVAGPAAAATVRP